MKQSSISKYFAFGKPAATTRKGASQGKSAKRKTSAQTNAAQAKRSRAPASSRLSQTAQSKSSLPTARGASGEVIDITDLSEDAPAELAQTVVPTNPDAKAASQSLGTTPKSNKSKPKRHASSDVTPPPTASRGGAAAPQTGCASSEGEVGAFDDLLKLQFSRKKKAVESRTGHHPLSSPSQDSADTRSAAQKLRHHRLQQLVFQRNYQDATSPLLSSSSSSSSSSSKRQEKEVKWTALEMQVRDIKAHHPDLFLFVEVGYRYRFFGKDAEIASRLLDIYAHQDRHYLVASIPTHRLSVHIARIVAAGYKVGVVRQTETAAIKKAASKQKSGSGSKCFTRSVTNVYTKGTLIPGEQFGADPELGNAEASSSQSGDSGGIEVSADQSNVILSLCEGQENPSSFSREPSQESSRTPDRATANSRDEVTIGLCAVNLATGVVVYDEFRDDFLRGALTTRLAHIQPIEILLPSSQQSAGTSESGQLALSRATESTLRMLENRGILNRTRMEHVRNPSFSRADALAAVSTVFSGAANAAAADSAATAATVAAASDAAKLVADLVADLPTNALRSMASLVEYLKSFGLERTFLAQAAAQSHKSEASSSAGGFGASSFLVPFASMSNMHLDGHTLVNLDVVASSTQQSKTLQVAAPAFATQREETKKQHHHTPATTLIQMLDQTFTRGGKARLRNWILRPLTIRAQIEERLDAVQELAFGISTTVGTSDGNGSASSPPNSVGDGEEDLTQGAPAGKASSTSPRSVTGPPACVQPILDILRSRKCPSLGLYVARLQQGKLTPVQFCEMLESFRRVLVALPRQAVAAAQVRSILLRRLLVGHTLDELPAVLASELARIHPDVVSRALGRPDSSSAKANDDGNGAGGSKRRALTDTQSVFVSVSDYPDLERLHNEVSAIEGMLLEHINEIRDFLGVPDLEYKTLCTGYSSQLEFLVELKTTGPHKSALDKVPHDWARVSTTKTVERFHTPTVARAVERLQLAREKIQIHTRLAWAAHLQSFAANHLGHLAEVASLMDTLDALQSLAQVAAMPNYCRPRFVDAAPLGEEEQKPPHDDSVVTSQGQGQGYLSIVNGRHPIVEVFNSASTASYVPNSVVIGTPPSDTEGASCILLTGPNMGGKSCLVRMIGLGVLMAQIGCYVAADSMTLTVFDGIYTRMGSSDSILSGMSTFLVEMSQTSHILARATSRSLVILDELGRGTSNLDGEAIAFATLRHCVERIGCATIFITHYPNLSSCSAYSKPHSAKAGLTGGTSSGDGDRREHQEMAITAGWQSRRVRNMHMAYLQEKAGEDDEDDVEPASGEKTISNEEDSSDWKDRIGALIRPVTFLYRVVDGPSPMSYGINVARMAGIQRSVLIEAAKVSAMISVGSRS